jgi:ribosomal protein L40E
MAMAGESEKVCPVCGERNPAILLECRNCEADLTGIKLGAADASPTAGTGEGAQTSLIKLCDCGAQNPPQARVCSACGEDISDVAPTPIAAGFAHFGLAALNGGYTFPIDKPVCFIGRECEMGDYLKNSLYVSRRHAKITVAGEEVYIENLSSTNNTYVNNEPIPSDKPTLLSVGDEIGLGGNTAGGVRQILAAYFILREI